MCRVLQISRNMYYYQLRKIEDHEKQAAQADLEERVCRIFKESRNNYGTRKIKRELAKQGFIVSRRRIGRVMKSLDLTCAERMNWEVNRGERRTFITTPYKFRLELQTNTDVIDSMTDNIKIKELRLETKKKGLDNDLSTLFSKSVNNIVSEVGEKVTIKEAVFNGFLSSNIVDPNGVRIVNSI